MFLLKIVDVVNREVAIRSYLDGRAHSSLKMFLLKIIKNLYESGWINPKYDIVHIMRD